MFRTTNGFIFKGKAKIGQEFIHESSTNLKEKDTVICIGNNLKDLIQAGDIIEYTFKSRTKPHGGWLFRVEKKSIQELKNNDNLVIKKIYVRYGRTINVESLLLPYKYTKNVFWQLGEKLCSVLKN